MTKKVTIPEDLFFEIYLAFLQIGHEEQNTKTAIQISLDLVKKINQINQVRTYTYEKEAP